ncbi:hypothetical protein GRF59_14955 [Paenibacillus sp. HJL G12]|uniref:Uncharacterized protein n=1 Tax=Paenibacillus dendrobii TaxID=2691084 RepID=A0A7X3IJ60_9BACL|nr:hypothetical protein [Paenibacillus dendrobii]MWV44919.1 hypothetical protein [Paenibacillus dendrobii]
MKLIELKEILEELISHGHENKDATYTNEGINFILEGYSIEDDKVRFW